MRAAIVDGKGEVPRFGDFELPVAGPGETFVNVTASALSQLTRGRASGAHYSAGATYPFIPGVDGVGRTTDGRRIYFVLPRSPFGAMAEHTVVPDGHWFELPDGIDDKRAAVIANPAMSSWAALTERARIQPGETVLVNGATGASGSLAVRIARHLGAGKVIATGRNAERLSLLNADAAIVLGDEPDQFEREMSAHFVDGVDIVLDYLWGPSARSLLIAGAKVAPEGAAIRFVQIGSVSGGEVAIPAAVLRSSAIEMMGSGIGSVPFDRLLAAVEGAISVAEQIGLALDYTAIPLDDVTRGWTVAGEARTVFVVR